MENKIDVSIQLAQAEEPKILMWYELTAMQLAYKDAVLKRYWREIGYNNRKK